MEYYNELLIRLLFLFQVTKLMERVEATFIKHFSNSNRSKGMGILRPTSKRERHRTTFSTGKVFMETFFQLQRWFFMLGIWGCLLSIKKLIRKSISGFLAGCTFSLILALILIVRARNLLHMEGQKIYMEAMFPLYR